MCSACAIMRPRSSKRAVEQSRRSLMLAENEARISTAPISSAIERSELPRTWSSIFTVWSRSATVASRSRQHQRAISIPIPHPPGGYEARCAVELDCGRTFDVQRLAGRQVEHRPGSGLGRADRDELELAGPVGVAVALLMRTMKGLREVALDRNRQLERLARIAQVRFALRRKVFYLGKGSHVWYDAVAPPLSSQTIEPPPAPTVCRSTAGSRSGRPATSRSAPSSARPPTISETSVDVPPMSNEIAFSNPARRASRAAPTVPAAGPDRSATAGCAAASSSDATPLDERITNGSGRPAAAARSPSAPR